MFVKRVLQLLLLFGACPFLQAGSDATDVLTLQRTDCPSDFPTRFQCASNIFRTFRGSCNNLCNTEQGAAFQNFGRFIPAAFESGTEPRNTASDGTPLPNPRTVSTTVFRSTSRNRNSAPSFTHITMTWGQFLDHDLTSTLADENLECGGNNEPCSIAEGCIGIDLGSNLLSGSSSAQCIPLARSARENDEQVNIISAYHDGSMIYGASFEEAQSLRDTDANIGLMKVRALPAGSSDRPILPTAAEETFCRSTSPEEKPCFLGGDFRRVNENHALMAMHTIWVREHNRIANQLHILNPLWGDERIFQEARKIVIAELQHITYNEWNAVLFNETVRENGGIELVPAPGTFNNYSDNSDASISNSFAAAALRFGHSLVRNTFQLLNKHYRRFGRLLTRDFFNPVALYAGGCDDPNGLGAITLGLIDALAQEIDPNFVSALRERLIIEGPTFDGIVGDLPAINIARGRDHGLPAYVAFRAACQLPVPTSFNELVTLGIMTQRQATSLEQVYAAVGDIDLFPGGISESAGEGSVIGPTFTCLLVDQLRRLRDGDRFWYERDNQVLGFTPEQLAEIRKVSLARVICDNVDDVKFVQPRVFQRRTKLDCDNPENNPLTSCHHIKCMNLNVFQEDPEAGPAAPAGAAVVE